ncbi:MAG: beta-propeller fold lactonase family protein [Terracidiphilus sp.]|jgi:6-phosphogluconolactonase (cycloisomerase 2 family)
MKFSKLSQLALVSAIGLIVATLLTACQLVTIDYVFVAASAGGGTDSGNGSASQSAGQIYGYATDAQSGAIRSAVPVVSSGGTVPVAMAITSDYLNLYVANQGNKTVVHFPIADDGTLTQKDSVTLPSTPVSLAVNAANTYLYVVSYAPSSTTNSATLTEYPLSSGTIGSAAATISLSLNCSGAAGSPSYPTDVIIPTGVTVLANNDAVFVTAYDQSAYNPGGSTSSNANPGWVFGFSVGSSGALSPAAKDCPITATTYQPYDVYQAGIKPSALAADPTSRFVYVTDYASNQLIGYEVLSTNALNFLINGPFRTGNEPTSIVIDPRGLYIYVTNSLDNSVSAYAITLSTGAPSTVVNSTSTASNATDTEPVSVTIEPSLGRFVYTANHLGNSLSGFRLNPSTGSLSATQATPYPTGANPTAVIAVPHGNHATQSVTP